MAEDEAGSWRPPLDLTQDFHENLFRNFVEIGTLEIEDKEPEEIIAAYGLLIQQLHDRLTVNEDDFMNSIDHRGTLFDQAQKAIEDQHYELAITLYAVWLEHFVNGMLITYFWRLGHDESISAPLIRELRLTTKATALWKLAKLPVIDPESLKSMNRIIEFRNAFVHYKWPDLNIPSREQQHQQVEEVARQGKTLVLALLAIESAVFWNGREKGLIEYFRADFLKRAGKDDQ